MVQAGLFETVRFSDSTLLIELELHLIAPDNIPRMFNLYKSTESNDPRYPTLHFAGSSTSVHGNETTVIGSVYMSGEGIVRWRFVSTPVRFSAIVVLQLVARFLLMINVCNGGKCSTTCTHKRPLTSLCISSSEGVQVGGIASATGVVGAWTGARHEPSPFSLSGLTHKLTLIYFHRGSCW